MKRLHSKNIIWLITLSVFVLLLCLTGCKKKKEAEEIAEPVEEIQETQTVEEDIPEEEPKTEEETVPETAEPDEPVFYERAKIVFLGCISEDRDLDMILGRAIDTLHLNTVRNIKKDHIVYGRRGNENNVYLIIPEKDITLTIASYPKTDKTYFQERNSKPVIFIEDSDATHLNSVFTAIKADDASEARQFYLGIDPSTNVLFVNDALSQGIEDQSDYDIFDESELKDYASMYEHYLYNEAPGASEDLDDENYGIGGSGYMILDDRVYVTYVISETLNPDKSYQYAIRYDDLTKSMEYMICLDGSGENWIEMGGE
ncbi:MAG: hypothetical protein IKE50_06565 [Erysipelotrichaceae bacterium]|nr:hypothetical protein [Erysipelotrichaceae bacterium]